MIRPMIARALSRPENPAARLLVVAAFAAPIAGPLAARSAEAAPILIESYAGERPADADELLRPVIGALEAASYAAPAEVAAQIDAKISRSSRPLTDEELAEASRFIDSGYQQFVSGSFDLAIKDLERGLSLFHRSPATLARKQEQREVYMRALIGVALSHKRLGQPAEATRAMAELLRTFPDKEISYRDYGPEPRDFYEKVKKDLRRQGLGSLTVEVDDASAVIFVNERYVGVGRVTLEDLIPGRYRVYVQKAERSGRVHDIDVEAGTPSTLSLTWPLEASLETRDRRVVLRFADEAERASLEGRFAVRIARALDADGVAVVSLREHNGRRAVVGSDYALASTQPEESAAVSVEPAPPSDERLGALGRFLAGDKTARELVEPIAPVPTGDPLVRDNPGRDRPESGGSLGLWKWVAVGGGVAGLAVGGTLIAVHEPEFRSDGSRNPVSRNSRPAGIAVGIAGLAVTGLGVYLFLRDSDSERERAVSVMPSQGGLTFAAVGRF